MRELKVNDIAYIKSKHAFNTNFTLLYSVVLKVNDVNYMIKLFNDSTAQAFKMHLDRLKLSKNRKNYLVSDSQQNITSNNTYWLRNRF